MVIGDIMNNMPTGKIQRITYKYEEKVAKINWFKIACEYIHKPNIEKDTKHVWNQLLKYAMNDTCKLDNTKGIGLIGRTGSGKSITMDIMRDIIKHNNIKYLKGGLEASFMYQIVSARTLAARYQESGHEAISRYSTMNVICIDDLGAENTQTKYYGDTLSVIEEIIENRYANNLITHFTSNLKPEQIQEIYGDRVYSRIMGEFNILTLSDKDYRISENK